MRIYRRLWQRSGKIKGIFGGKIASQQEVKCLNKRIRETEQAELADFENEFDKKLKKL